MSGLAGRRVAVLMGGVSAERSISLESGQASASALRDAGFAVREFDVREDFEERFRPECSSVDVAFIALHGRYGEDGQVQAYLESLGLPYTGSGVEASRIAMDKCAAKDVFVKAGVPTPPSVTARRGTPVGKLDLGLPVVVKPAREGSTIGVTIVLQEEDLQGALAVAFQYDDCALIESFVEGPELTVAILSGRCLPIIRVVPSGKFYDYRAKYLDSGTRFEVPAKLAPDLARRVEEAALMAYEALGCTGLARVDLIAGGPSGCQVLEVNTIPGLTPHSLVPMAAKAAGLSFVELCVQVVQDAMERAGLSGRESGGGNRRGKLQC